MCRKKGCIALKNARHPKPSSKIDGNKYVCLNGKYRLINVVLEHNHALFLGKAQYYKLNIKLDSQVKRRIELNDQVGT